jgi:hypothetical protein
VGLRNPLSTCGRCGQGFKAKELLLNHQQRSEPCLVKSDKKAAVGMINLSQAIELRSLKKRAVGVPDKEKWYELYRILFSSQDAKNLPTPCELAYSQNCLVFRPTNVFLVAFLDYNNEGETASNLSSDNKSPLVADYVEYLRRPRSVEEQQALELELGKELGIHNSEMCRILASKFRNYQLQELYRFETLFQSGSNGTKGNYLAEVSSSRLFEPPDCLSCLENRISNSYPETVLNGPSDLDLFNFDEL